MIITPIPNRGKSDPLFRRRRTRNETKGRRPTYARWCLSWGENSGVTRTWNVKEAEKIGGTECQKRSGFYAHGVTEERFTLRVMGTPMFPLCARAAHIASGCAWVIFQPCASSRVASCRKRLPEFTTRKLQSQTTIRTLLTDRRGCEPPLRPE